MTCRPVLLCSSKVIWYVSRAIPLSICFLCIILEMNEFTNKASRSRPHKPQWKCDGCSVYYIVCAQFCTRNFLHKRRAFILVNTNWLYILDIHIRTYIYILWIYIMDICMCMCIMYVIMYMYSYTKYNAKFNKGTINIIDIWSIIWNIGVADETSNTCKLTC